MNRKGLVIAITTTALLLGVGGWYTRSWWWGAKPTASKTAEKKEGKEKPPEKGLSEGQMGGSAPTAKVASARMNNRFAGKPDAASFTKNASQNMATDEEASLESDDNETEEDEPAPVRPTSKFAAKFGRNTDQEPAPSEDPAAAEASTETESGEMQPEEAASDAGAEEEPAAGAEEAETTKIEENTDPAAETEAPAEDDKPLAKLPTRRDTSRAPPLRSKQEETTTEQAPELPADEVVRIQEPKRAASAVATRPEPTAAPEAPAKRSLKVAQPLTSPPALEETPIEAPREMTREQATRGARAIDGDAAELTSLISRAITKPEEAPGDRRLEGEQSAPLTLTKSAPSEVSVGRPATFETRVRNNGSSIAHQVIVMDRVPRGARLIDASPRYTQTAEGNLIWDLGNLDPGQEALIKMQLMPEEEGEIGSVASASYQVKATARTVSTRPQLEVEHSGPTKALVGDLVSFHIRIHNPGTGVARGVRIEEDVPPGLSHNDGRQLEFEIGDLPPGKTREIALDLTAAEAGGVRNTIRVRGEGDLVAEHTTELEVLAPQLVAEITGPKRRYLDRQANYSIRVANPGTAAAKTVDFHVQLPTGLKYQNADSSGRYDSKRHTVHWKIPQLPAGEEGVVQLSVLSMTSGQQALKVAARAENGLEATNELAVLVEAAPETTFAVRDSSDPIEVGADATYEIVVSNRGTRADSQVRIEATLPAEMQITSAEGPTAHTVDGQRVIFEPLGRLDPKSEVTYKIKIRATAAAADPRVVRVQATSAALTTPVSREESTLIYEDR